MKNRYKFRVFITCSIQNDTEDKEISFYVYDAVVYSHGLIGFSQDSLSNALSKLNLTEEQKEQIEEQLYENSQGEFEWYVIDFGIVEQCTGFNDKCGKLIWEGDIIKLTQSRNYGWLKKGTKLKIQWNTFACCGFGFGARGNLTQKCAQNCIVVGNIQENPELLE